MPGDREGCALLREGPRSRADWAQCPPRGGVLPDELPLRVWSEGGTCRPLERFARAEGLWASVVTQL